jgi:hypothetical protein
MAKSVDEIEELKGKIGKYITIGKENLSYQVKKSKTKVSLQLITFNPLHNQRFLFHACEADSAEECFRQMLKYVQYHKEEESSYTMQWTLLGENKLHTSYFRANSILGALNKLYFDRDPNGIIVFSVILNPIS